MECLNKVELQGVVGSNRTLDMGVGNKMYHLTLATNSTYKASDGTFVIEATWHNVSVPDYSIDSDYVPQKGDTVHLSGKIKNHRYQDMNGNSHSEVTIYADSFNKVSDESVRV